MPLEKQVEMQGDNPECYVDYAKVQVCHVTKGIQRIPSLDQNRRNGSNKPSGKDVGTI